MLCKPTVSLMPCDIVQHHVQSLLCVHIATLPDGKQPSMGLPEGALAQARSGPGETESANGPGEPSMGYPSAVSYAARC